MKAKAFVAYWEHRPRRKVIEMVYFVWVMGVCTDSDSDFDFGIEGSVARNLLVVELCDFRWRYDGESGG